MSETTDDAQVRSDTSDNGESGVGALWAMAIFGVLIGAVGGVLLILGFSEGSMGMTITGWLVSAVGGLMTAIGTVAIGVYMGLTARG